MICSVGRTRLWTPSRDFEDNFKIKNLLIPWVERHIRFTWDKNCCKKKYKKCFSRHEFNYAFNQIQTTEFISNMLLYIILEYLTAINISRLFSTINRMNDDWIQIFCHVMMPNIVQDRKVILEWQPRYFYQRSILPACVMLHDSCCMRNQITIL